MPAATLDPQAPAAPALPGAGASTRLQGPDTAGPMATLVLICVLGLLAIGFTTLFSASAHAKPDNPYFYIERQAMSLAVAAVMGVIVAFTDLSLARKFAPLLYLAILGLLILTLIPGIGITVKGSRRWLDLGPMNLQASELAKAVVVFVVAHYLSLNQSKVESLVKGFVVPMILTGVVAGLIFLQPDFGTAALVGVLGFTLMFLAGTRLLYLIPTIVAGGGLFFLMVFLDPVRWARITAFVNMDDPEVQAGGGYQLRQAILAFGAGGVEGVGVGNGRQQLAFIPEAHNDFILAITGEEMGLVATLGVAGLFLCIFLLGVRQVRKAPNLFHYLLLSGCISAIAFQSLINLGVVTGLLPTKGMSLPFVSAGGSNLMLMAVLLGLMFNVQRSATRIQSLGGDRELKEAVP